MGREREKHSHTIPRSARCMALRNPRGMYLHTPTLRHRLVSHREVDDHLRTSTLACTSESEQLIGEKSMVMWKEKRYMQPHGCLRKEDVGLKIATRLTILVASGPCTAAAKYTLTTSPSIFPSRIQPQPGLTKHGCCPYRVKQRARV